MDRDVCVIGPLNVDLLLTGKAPIQIEELTQWAGESNVTLCAAGSAGYIVQDLSRFGLKTGIISIVADDPFGDGILRMLEESGLDTSQVSQEKGTLSGIGVYMLLFGSKKRPLTYRLWTHLPWPETFSKEQKGYIFSHRLIHMAGYLHYPKLWNNELHSLFKEAKMRGHITSMDPQFPLYPVEQSWMEPLVDVLPYTDYLLLDENEARMIAGTDHLDEALKKIHVAGPKHVIIKLGSDGSMCKSGELEFKQPAIFTPEDEIVESIGAGDAFDSGVIYGILQEWEIRKCIKLGTLAAASTLHGSGGTSSLEPIKSLLKKIQN